MKWYSKKKIYIRRLSFFIYTLGIDLKKIYFVFTKSFRFLNDLINFKRKNGQIRNILPILSDFEIDNSDHENHFFHSDLLIAQKIFDKNPENHIDIGSRIDGLVSHIASFRNLDCVDIKNINIKPHKNINFLQLDITDNKIINKKKYFSVSSVGLLSHVGLGRYGDKIDPDGHLKAIQNLCNLCERNGLIYIMVPVGKSGVEFNSHRVFNPHLIVENFKIRNCELIEFSLINDDGELNINSDLNSAINLNFGGGVFVFIKK